MAGHPADYPQFQGIPDTTISLTVGMTLSLSEHQSTMHLSRSGYVSNPKKPGIDPVFRAFRKCAPASGPGCDYSLVAGYIGKKGIIRGFFLIIAGKTGSG
jgi:hypothetical protein